MSLLFCAGRGLVSVNYTAIDPANTVILFEVVDVSVVFYM